MTLPSVPPISMSDIAAELSQALPLSLNDANARALAGIPAGSISLLDFLGKSSSIKFNIVVATGNTGGLPVKGFVNSLPPIGSTDNSNITGFFNGTVMGVVGCYLAMDFNYPRIDGQTCVCGTQSETLVFVGTFGLGTIYRMPTMVAITNTPDGGTVHAEIS